MQEAIIQPYLIRRVLLLQQLQNIGYFMRLTLEKFHDGFLRQ